MALIFKILISFVFVAFSLTDELGGSATVYEVGFFAFRSPSPSLTEEELKAHIEGDRIFESQFVSDPSSVQSGLGPHFFNTSCRSCHVLDGRGSPFIGKDFARSQAVLKVFVRPFSDSKWKEVQATDRAVTGYKPLADVKLKWIETSTVEFPDGELVTLRKPVLDVTLNSEKVLYADKFSSIRIAPPVYGLGLLEAISQSDIEENHQKNHPNALLGAGRFGWKADSPSVYFQTAKAFFNDMGLTSAVFPGQGLIEISPHQLERNAFYVSSLGVPVRRRIYPELEDQGEAVFRRIGCASCHQPTWKTDYSPISGFSNQTIHPFTDLLLHDMGEDLSENPMSDEKIHRFWRTPPLWGIGLAQKLNNKVGFLHDGRARNFEEAILWHSGEAKVSKTKYLGLSSLERKALSAFLKSL